MIERFADDDTIVAIATPPGEGGIGIVRLSGQKALRIAEGMFSAKNRVRLSRAKTHTVHYGVIAEKPERAAPAKVLDEVIVTVMRAPRTYTREDIVEINCHGGMIPLRKVVELACRCGARLAQPGEFTQRAFLNGRIDLVQAEAVLNVISAKTDAAFRPAMQQLRGTLSERINALREKLIGLIAPLEAGVDFPDDVADRRSKRNFTAALEAVQRGVQELIAGAEKGVILHNGIRVALVGAANVGKSSIMNALLEYERVIVTDISGTTRDVVEETLIMQGIPVRIADTAGIMESACVITKESIQRTFAFIEQADLVLFVVDASRKLGKTDREVAEKLRNKKVIVVINKTDLASKIDEKTLKDVVPGARWVRISALKKTNLSALEKQIGRMFFRGTLSAQDEVLVTGVRHKEALEQCLRNIQNAAGAAKNNGYDECLIFELRQALQSLGVITGETVREDILDAIFSRFCIGK